MAKKGSVYDVRTTKDVISYASRKGGKVSEGSNHIRIEGSGNQCTFVPRHTGDLPRGTRFAIIKQLIAIGLGIFIVVVFISFF